MTARTAYADPSRSELAAMYDRIADSLLRHRDMVKPDKMKAKLAAEAMAYRNAATKLKDDTARSSDV